MQASQRIAGSTSCVGVTRPCGPGGGARKAWRLSTLGRIESPQANDEDGLTLAEDDDGGDVSRHHRTWTNRAAEDCVLQAFVHPC